MHVIFCTVLALMAPLGRTSAVATDLAMLARSPDDHPAANLIGMQVEEPRPRAPVSGKSMVHKHESSPTMESTESQPLHLWRVRIALAVVIIAMVAALGSLAVHAAQVFGLLPDDKREIPASPKEEADPESLTRLLNMQSIRGYGAIFSSRGLIGSSSAGADKPTIIIQ
jgi:hypothetical protein